MSGREIRASREQSLIRKFSSARKRTIEEEEDDEYLKEIRDAIRIDATKSSKHNTSQ